MLNERYYSMVTLAFWTTTTKFLLLLCFWSARLNTNDTQRSPLRSQCKALETYASSAQVPLIKGRTAQCLVPYTWPLVRAGTEDLCSGRDLHSLSITDACRNRQRTDARQIERREGAQHHQRVTCKLYVHGNLQAWQQLALRLLP